MLGGVGGETTDFPNKFLVSFSLLALDVSIIKSSTTKAHQKNYFWL